jgi:hypothetical protein
MIFLGGVGVESIIGKDISKMIATLEIRQDFKEDAPMRQQLGKKTLHQEDTSAR